MYSGVDVYARNLSLEAKNPLLLVPLPLQLLRSPLKKERQQYYGIVLWLVN